MFNTIMKHLKSTSSYLVIRMAVSLLLSCISILLTIVFQSFALRILGDGFFAAFMSLIVSLLFGALFAVMSIKFIDVILDTLQTISMAYTDEILERNLSSIAVGVRGFKEYVVSIGILFACNSMVKELLEDVVDSFWDNIPESIGTFIAEKIGNNSLLRIISKDILHYSVYACIFYYVKKIKNKSDIVDTIQEIAKRYIISLPLVTGTSIATYYTVRIFPNALIVVGTVLVIMYNGLSSILPCVLISMSLTLILNVTILDTIVMIAFISAFYNNADEVSMEKEDDIISSVDVDSEDKTECESSEVKQDKPENMQNPERKIIPTRLNSDQLSFLRSGGKPPRTFGFSTPVTKKALEQSMGSIENAMNVAKANALNQVLSAGEPEDMDAIDIDDVDEDNNIFSEDDIDQITKNLFEQCESKDDDDDEDDAVNIDALNRTKSALMVSMEESCEDYDD